MKNKASKYKNLGLYIKSLRLNKGIGGIKKAASLLGLNYTYLSKIENGRKPSTDVIRSIVEVYRLTESEINNLYQFLNMNDFENFKIREGVNFKMEEKEKDNGLDSSKNVIPSSNSGVKINMDVSRTPVLYGDSVFVKADANGYVLDFAQQVGPTKEFNIVARIGLSKDHVKRLIGKLNNLVKKAEGVTETGKVKLVN